MQTQIIKNNVESNMINLSECFNNIILNITHDVLMKIM